METKRKTGEERSQEILENALRIIHEQGHSSLTVRNIAERTRISEAAVYSHFDGKEQIIRELSEQVFEKDQVKCDATKFETPEEMLEELVNDLFSDLEENPEITALVFNDELFTEYPEVKKLFRQHREQNKEQMEEIIKEGKKEGMISEDVDPATFSTIISGTIMMAVREWREQGMEEPLKERTGEIVRELSKILEKDS